MKVLVLGFYDRQNLGDDMFKIALTAVLPRCTLTFVCTDDFKGDVKTYDAIVCGGGDIVNRYFIDRIKTITAGYTKPLLAYGIGISWVSTVEDGLLDIFDHVIVRNQVDARVLQHRLGSTYAHYLPDLGFALPTSDQLPSRTSGSLPRVGICLAQPSARQAHFTTVMSSFIDYLRKRYTVVLIPFNTSANMAESDLQINRAVVAGLKDHTNVEIIEASRTPTEMLSLLGTLDYAVVHRFHAHIFCTLVTVPFLSIATCRKTKTYMAEIAYPHVYIPDEKGGEFSLSVTALAKAFSALVINAPATLQHLVLTRRRYRALHQPVDGLHKMQALLDNGEIRLKRPIVSRVEAINRIYMRAHAELGSPGSTGVAHAERVAELVCFDITRTPGSKYVYGTSCNLQERPHDLRGMIEWIYDDHAASISNGLPRLNIDYIAQDTFKGVHRAGWQYVVDHLQCLNTWNGVICDTYIDRTFHWGATAMAARGVIPYTSPWIGILHHTHHEGYTAFNAKALVQSILFQQSLPMCRGIVCLSTYLATTLRTLLTEIGFMVPIVCLYHPTLFVGLTFTPSPKPALVNVGAWYRNPWTIYRVVSPLPKKTLRGPAMDNYFPTKGFVYTRKHIDGTSPCTNKWGAYLCEYILSHNYLVKELGLTPADVPSEFSFGLDTTPSILPLPQEVGSPQLGICPAKSSGAEYVTALKAHLATLLASVEVVERLDDAAYDTLFTSNVVFLDLVDCSAANTIIEAIVRHTPVLVNRLPAVVEYLGAGYPLYYSHLDEITTLLTPDRITATNKYLAALDKTPLMVDTFIAGIRTQVYPLL